MTLILNESEHDYVVNKLRQLTDELADSLKFVAANSGFAEGVTMEAILQRRDGEPLKLIVSVEITDEGAPA